MIQYHKSAFGWSLLLRVSGSAVYRSMIPGVLSVMCVLLMNRFWVEDNAEFEDASLEHPYAVGVLVASLTFLLVFRVQQGYARYWEACSAVHHMMSKWMDAIIHTAAFHMQCAHYDAIKPPSFFEHPELNRAFLSRSRERFGQDEYSNNDETVRLHKRAFSKSIEQIDNRFVATKANVPVPVKGLRGIAPMSHEKSSELGDPVPLEGPTRYDGNWGNLFNDGKATFFNPKHPEAKDVAGFASHQGGHTPPLFLQELTHLASLMTGVALSTLRNDVEGSESPLDIYEPGSPWPAVDPDRDDSRAVPTGGRKAGLRYSFWQRIRIFLGQGRSPEERTQYNAARPLPVLGGVSDGEIRFLQMARGPAAKTQLCWYWISEFITREHLAGSLGKVGPPIVSRIIQFLGDGMIFYNHARKIMFIPFPFPHAQLSVFYVVVAIPAVAVLMVRFAENLIAACLLAFFTVTCLSGIHEVARELENPFRNIPNEIPLVTLQAQFNETLITMYAGFHPDHYWGAEAKRFSQQDTASESDSSDADSKAPAPVSPEKPAAANEPQKVDANAKNNNSSSKPSPRMERSIEELLEQMNQQKIEMEQRMAQMAAKQQQESERQRAEIERLRTQLNGEKSSTSVTMPPIPREEKKNDPSIASTIPGY